MDVDALVDVMLPDRNAALVRWCRELAFNWPADIVNRRDFYERRFQDALNDPRHSADEREALTHFWTALQAGIVVGGPKLSAEQERANDAVLIRVKDWAFDVFLTPYQLFGDEAEEMRLANIIGELKDGDFEYAEGVLEREGR